MKTRRPTAFLLGILTLLVFCPSWAFAQSGGGGGSGGGGSGSGGGGSGSSGGGGGIGSGSGIGSSSGIGASGGTSTIKGTTGTAGSATSIPSSSNPFATNYISPLSLGMASSYYPNGSTFGSPNKSSGIFGKALYSTTTNTTTTGSASTSTGGSGFSTVGTIRAPRYTTSLSDDVPAILHPAPELLAKIRDVLDRSRYLQNRDQIQVGIDGPTVTLRGQVASEKERRLVEGMVRMTPGVREVQNQLQVVAATK